MNDAKFFVVIPVGFEEMAALEMSEVWPFLKTADGGQNPLVFPDVKIELGGVEFEAPLWAGLQLHFFLKIPSRILLRLESFRLRNLDQLTQRLGRLGLNRFFTSGQILLSVACSESFFNNEKLIFSSVEESLGSAFEVSHKKHGQKQRMYVRVHKDICTISVDGSGEHLHKRGYKDQGYEAPLRETLAAILLRLLIADRPASELQHVTLVDPVVGSGTLLTEAGLWNLPVLTRGFAFQSWQITPRFLKFPHIKFQVAGPTDSKSFKNLLGFDKSLEAITKARIHAEQAGLSHCKVELLDWSHEHSARRVDAPEAPVWIIGNLPYGERLAKTVTDHWFVKMEEAFRPERILFMGVHFENQLWPKSWRQVQLKRFRNGGLKIEVVLLERAFRENVASSV